MRIYRHIIPEIGTIPLNKLTQNDLQQFYARQKSNGRLYQREQYGPELSDRMIREIHASCRMALEKAKEDGLIFKNPAVGCKIPPKKAKEMQVLTHEEMQRLLIQAKEDGCYEMLILELSTGLRRGEFAALEWDDLNMSTGELRIDKQVYRVKGELTVSQPKTKASTRTVILPPTVVKVLADYKEKQDPPSKWIFPSPHDPEKTRDPGAIRYKVQKAMERAGCKVVRFHDLRHTFATTALEHGMDVKMLSTIIGHTSSATTIDIYSHVTDHMQLQAANKIEKGFGRNEAFEAGETAETDLPEQSTEKPVIKPFEPYKGKIRKPGTGCLYQINDHLWEESYHPTNADGKREGHTVYAKTREECEKLLETMIEEVRNRIKAEKEQRKNETKTAL